MEVISKANHSVMNVISRFFKSSDKWRLSNYCISSITEDGVLLFNLLTREMLLLNQAEFDSLDNDYLRKNFFLVPASSNEKELADICRIILGSKRPVLSEINSYVIFTTTDCNARCFYCFEKGRSREPMSEETAYKLLDYIKRKSKGKPVILRWFGGEPLMNTKVIDIICNGLIDADISYHSTMVSNGYLFDDDLIQKAVELWKLKGVQITLDGTENVYNKVKAYVEYTQSPYSVVMANIAKLAAKSINVRIRMNMDLYNADDLLKLCYDLVDRFKGISHVKAYAHHLFKDGVAIGSLHSDEEWEKRDLAISKIEDVLRSNGLISVRGFSPKPRLNHCMADDGTFVTVLPNGNIGLCEHHTEGEFIGNLDSDEFDMDVVKSWRETVPEIEECKSCFYFPDCINLRKCTNATVCYPQYRASRRREVIRQMQFVYDKWKSRHN